MKKFLWGKGVVYLLGLLFMVVAFSPVFAQTIKKYAIVKVSAANIRSAPSKNGSIVHMATKGEKLELVEDLGTWLKVRTKSGVVGFVYSPLVQVEIEKVVAPSEQPPSQQPPPTTSVQPPTPPPSGARTTVSRKRSLLPLYIAGGAAVAGVTAYLLFRKGGLLNKGTATLRVNSTPSEAKVYVDDEEKCETPCTVENVSPGTHTIKVVRELYGEWSREMEVKGYQEYDIEAELSPYGYDFDFCFGRAGGINGEFRYPWDLTLDQDENIYVADTSNYRIQKFDSSGNFITKVDTITPGGTRLHPTGIVYSSHNDRIYVVFYNDPSRALDWYNLTLHWIGNKSLILDKPLFLGVDSSGNIYVADTGNDRIVKTNPNGSELTEWYTGSDTWPTEAAPGSNGDVYVSLSNADKVAIYSSSGSPKGEFSKTIDGPSGVAVDRMGHVYVTAKFEDKVYKFMPDGNLILSLGNSGDFNLPLGIAIFENGDLAIIDTYRNRVCIWRLTKETISFASAKIAVKRKKGSSINPSHRIALRKTISRPNHHPRPRKIRK